MTTWWDIYTATLYLLFCRWTPDNIEYRHTPTLYQFSCTWTTDDIYIPQLYINFPPNEHVIICTYRKFISTFLQMTTWWYIHTATLYQLSCTRTRNNIYIRQLYMNFSADEHVVICTCYNFILTFRQMNTWWYIHIATLYQLSCRWTPDDIYLPQHYIKFPADEHVMIYTYRNFLSIFQQINTWWYIPTATFYQLSSR